MLPLGADRKLVVGVSGGPDSLCLLDLLYRSHPSTLVVAHFNHKLRPEAEAEAEMVEALAARLGLAFVIASDDVAAYARSNRLSLEEAARKLRYRFLFKQARRRQAGGVAVAHTADDQVETILMNLLRGTGMNGLRGMQAATILPEFDPLLPLLRPILHLWRTEVEAYCREHDLQPVRDATNQDQAYLRNRLRHTVIPLLEGLNPRFKESIHRMGQSLGRDFQALEDMVAAAWAGVHQGSGPGYVTFNLLPLLKHPPGLRRGFLHRAALSLQADLRDLDHEAWQRAEEFLAGIDNGRPAGGQVDLANGLYLVCEGDALHLASRAARLPFADWPQVGEPGWLVVGGSFELGAGWRLTADLVPGGRDWSQAQENRDPAFAWLDAGRCGEQFEIRSRRAGERFQPLGMDAGTMKLSDFLVNEKIPERARARWPLVCAGGQVAWVAGCRIAHPFRIQEETKQAVRLALLRPPGGS